ncbi:MAG TPA: HIT domain-containing protein [Candidatus Angelobacter sp.]|nr:HIT domain-containing protein [Candidatus Angelobacter sp.]
MDHLFTPWRYAYITGMDKIPGCLFCNLLAMQDDARALIVHRAEHCFVVLNAFPYTSGHVMIVPYQHTDQLRQLPAPAAAEMIALTQRCEGILRELYSPDGLNLGMNLGRAAGAGVASHIHMHILPRWVGDTNFMSAIGEARILPEDLESTRDRIQQKFTASSGA